jgi:hypothetical protein
MWTKKFFVDVIFDQSESFLVIQTFSEFINDLMLFFLLNTYVLEKERERERKNESEQTNSNTRHSSTISHL